MSGGSNEYTAAYVDNWHNFLQTYGESLVNGVSKNKDVYARGAGDTTQGNYNGNSNKYGDGVWETSNSVGSWFEDISIFPEFESPFFHRGGFWNYYSSAGVFTFNCYGGYAYNDLSFRPVLIVL